MCSVHVVQVEICKAFNLLQIPFHNVKFWVKTKKSALVCRSKECDGREPLPGAYTHQQLPLSIDCF